MGLRPLKKRKLSEGSQNVPAQSFLAKSSSKKGSINTAIKDAENKDFSEDSGDYGLTQNDPGSPVEEQPQNNESRILPSTFPPVAETPQVPSRVITDERKNRENASEGPPKIKPGISDHPNKYNSEVEKVLRHARPKHGATTAAAEEVVRKVKTVIESIPNQEPSSVHEAKEKLLKSSGIIVPFPSPRPSLDSKYNLAFAQPTSINVVGSYSLKTGSKVNSPVSIDVVVFMPPILFSEKDYLDYRYFYKRAYYLACLAASIQREQDFQVKLSFQHHNGNPLVPVLVIKPCSDLPSNGFATSGYEIIIMPALNHMIFPLAKTLPDRPCIRQKDALLNSTIESKATPFYNATLRADCSVNSFLKLIYTTIAENSFYRDACILGRIWLERRGLGKSVREGGFGAFEWNVLLAILLQGEGSNGKPMISSAYDSVQLFRAMLQFLATRDLGRQPLIWGTALKSSQSETDNLPMVFDGHRGLNILYKMNASSYKILQQEARISATSFNRGTLDPFRAMFRARLNEPLMKYDLSVLLTDIPIQWSNDRLYQLFFEGLGNRVDVLAVQECHDVSWSISAHGPGKSTDRDITLGLILDQKNSVRTVDRGPSAEDATAAAAFRSFWGEKAELRRFKDGAILESLVWTQNQSAAATVKEIILYLVANRVAQSAASNAKFIGQDFEEQIAVVCGSSQKSLHVAPISNSFTSLEKDIRSLEGLPLHIKQLFLVTEPSASAKYRANDGRANVILQFEGSSKWPDKLDAIQITKASFLLMLADRLRETAQNTITVVGMENQHRQISNKFFLDIDYQTGARFRIRIHHDREQDLIERHLKDDSLTTQERTETASWLAEYRRVFLRRPLHRQAMESMSTRFPAFPATVQVIKAWFNAHLLGPHFSEEAIEIITARSFLHPSPWSVPSSAMTGFFRTLFHLSIWDWRNEPLFVDYSGTMKTADKNMVYTRFAAWRRIDPLLNRVALFIATSHDTEGTIWTENYPSKVLGARMSSLTQSACRSIEENGLNTEFASLFISPLDDYDFVLRLDSAYTSKRQRKNATKKSAFKNLTQDPVLSESFDALYCIDDYLQELQQSFAGSIIFFHNQVGGEIISGIWNPQANHKRWKVHLAYSSLCSDATSEEQANDEVDATINKDAILAEIVRLGGDMISSVEVNR